MFTAAHIYDGRDYLEKHLCANDYYAKGETVTGAWTGELAKIWGLENLSVAAGDRRFEAVRKGLMPDGSGDSLTPRARVRSSSSPPRRRDRPERVAFIDFQCSARKSVSIMAVTLGDDRLREAHERAARFAFSLLGEFAARRVKRPAPGVEITGNVLAAAFTHDASRELDPQLHTHFVTANVTRDAGGARHALTEREMFRAIALAGRAYQNEMARAALAAGYEIDHVRGKDGRVEGFEIRGVSLELRRRFSRRRAQVEEAARAFKAERGREPSPAELHVLAKTSRAGDTLAEITTPEVRARQLARLSAGELEALRRLKAEAEARAAAIAKPEIPGAPPASAGEHTARPLEGAGGESSVTAETAAAARAAEEIFERLSAAPGRAILTEALRTNPGTVEFAALREALAAHPGLRPLEENPGHPLLTRLSTEENLRLEARCLELAAGGRESVEPFLPPGSPVLERAGQWTVRHRGHAPDGEQLDAVRAALLSRDAVTAVRGVAGAGKTSMLLELEALLKDLRVQTLHLAPTAAAADVLRREGFANAMTVAAFEAAAERDPEAFRDCFTVVDEAGLLSVRQGARLLEKAKALGQRLLLAGDTRQHVSVEAGDFLRLLERERAVSAAGLKNIRRQRPPHYREAVARMAAGEPLEGLALLEASGMVRECRGAGPDGAGDARDTCPALPPAAAERPPLYLERAAAEFCQKAAAHGLSSALAVAPAWREIGVLNRLIREGLAARGLMEGNGGAGRVREVFAPFGWSAQMKRDIRNFTPGQVLHFTAAPRAKAGKNKTARLASGSAARPGETVRVKAVEKKRLILEDGRAVIPWRDSARFEPGERRLISIHPGERLLIRANDRRANLINGELLHAAAFAENGDILTGEGKTIPAGFAHLAHGWALTSHASQGKTVDHVVTAAERLDARAFYVSSSRGRESLTLFTPDLALFKAELARAGDAARPAAAEVLVPAPPPPEPEPSAVKKHPERRKPETSPLPGPWLHTVRRLLETADAAGGDGARAVLSPPPSAAPAPAAGPVFSPSGGGSKAKARSQFKSKPKPQTQAAFPTRPRLWPLFLRRALAALHGRRNAAAPSVFPAPARAASAFTPGPPAAPPRL